MKSRYKKLFKKLFFKQEGCFIPFVVLGDPTIKISLKIIDILVENGADALELGIPFSDPIADGIIIQNAHERALKNKISIEKCFLMINEIRKKHASIPIGILTYANLIFFKKKSNFYSMCQSYGIDSVLIADLPIEESDAFQKIANQYKISSIFICPPNAKKKIIKKIVQVSQSYIYLVSRPGITGKHQINSTIELKKTILRLKKNHSSPIIQGFGIHKTNQIKKILNNGIQGIICGSCIVQIIEKNLLNSKKIFKKMKEIIIKFKRETKILNDLNH